MKNNPIWENLTHIREDFIEEAAPDQASAHTTVRKKRIRNRLIGWSSLAACLVIVAGATFPLWKQSLNIATEDDAYAHYPLRNEYDFMERYPSLAIIPTFPYEIDGESCSMQYPALTWEEQEYRVATAGSSPDYFISADLIEDEIGQIEAEVHDMGHTATVGFTLYRIKGIDEKIAFAALHEGGEKYVVYRASHIIDANSWSELVELVDLQINLTASENIFHTITDKNGKEVRLVFEGMTPEILWNELLSHGKLVDFNGEDGDYLRISIDHAVLNTRSVLCITSDGYITFGMIKSGKALYVGKDHVRAFVDYLEDHLTGYRLVDPSELPSNPEADTPQTGVVTTRVTSAAPPYNPKPQ